MTAYSHSVGTDWVTLLIFFISMALVIWTVIKKPRVKIPNFNIEFNLDYSMIPLAFTLLMWMTTLIDTEIVTYGIVGDSRIRPYAIVILFMSLAYVCVALDQSGFLIFVSYKIVQKARNSYGLLFTYIFFLASGLTILTSNDTVILLTPVIYYFTEMLSIDPMPYLYGEFIAANIWSSTLFIGNPTNIIVAEAFDLTFLEFSKWTLFPTIVTGLTSFGTLYWYYRKDIGRRKFKTAKTENEDGKVIKVEDGNEQTTETPSDAQDNLANLQNLQDPYTLLSSPINALVGVVVLFLCLFFLATSRWTGLELYLICLVSALAHFSILFTINYFGWEINLSSRSTNVVKRKMVEDVDKNEVQMETIEEADKKEKQKNENEPKPIEVTTEPVEEIVIVKKSWKQTPAFSPIWVMPWKIVPFVLPMFVLVEALSYHRWVPKFAMWLSAMCGNNFVVSVIVFFLTSIFLCNIINNQPMTILLTRVLLSEKLNITDKRSKMGAIYAVVLGSNYGANFTLIGALAGIMWITILRTKNVHISYLQFMKVGFSVMIPSLIFCTIVLCLQLLTWL